MESLKELYKIGNGPSSSHTMGPKKAAEQFAKDSESELGKIKMASQGLFSISDRDSYTPYIKRVRVVTSVDFYLRD